MELIDITIIFFVVMELLNVIILYFYPNSTKGNGVAIFKPWQRSKDDEALNLFVQYMTNWVAGIKLIFIVLLLVIVFVGNDLTKLLGAVVMIISIATFFFRLNPLMHKLDAMGEINPKGYSKKLKYMIIGFITMFSAALLIHFFLGA